MVVFPFLNDHTDGICGRGQLLTTAAIKVLLLAPPTKDDAGKEGPNFLDDSVIPTSDEQPRQIDLDLGCRFSTLLLIPSFEQMIYT